MASQNNRQFVIENGPGKFDFMLSLFDNIGHRPRTVGFTLQGITQPLAVSIDSIAREDGSGESWNFKGTLRDSATELYFSVEGYFSSKTRKGHMRFVMRNARVWDTTHFRDLTDVEYERKVDVFVNGLQLEATRVRGGGQ
jgi:hypothetical protein